MADNDSGTGKGLKESIADEVKGLAVEVYKDAAKPTVGAVGATLGGVAKLLMWPIDLITRTGNAALEKLGARVERKLRGVDAQHLLPPPAMIAAQASLGYVLLGDSDTDGDGKHDAAEPLRDMFASLLAAAMDRTRASYVHPAFVSLISQISHDEAWLLKSIIDPNNTYAIVEGRRPMDKIKQDLGRGAGGVYRDYHHTAHGMYRRLGWFSTLGVGIGIDESRQEQYLSNLVRLGILAVNFDVITEPSEEDADESKAAADYDGPRRRMDEEFHNSGFECVGHRGVVSITPLGRQFLLSCVLSPHS